MFIDHEILYRWNWDFNLIHEIYSIPAKINKATVYSILIHELEVPPMIFLWKQNIVKTPPKQNKIQHICIHVYMLTYNWITSGCYFF